MKNTLTELGLSENEIDIYMFLARHGEASSRQIIMNTGIHKSSAHMALNLLLEKSLISQTNKTRNRTYIASDTNQLKEINQKKINELLDSRSKIESLILELDIYTKNQYKSTNIKVFEGDKGYLNWLDDRLVGNHKLINEIAPLSSVVIHFDNYREEMLDIVKKRVNKGIKIKTLISKNERKDIIDKTDKDFLKEARRTKINLDFGSVFTTYGSKTAFYSNKDGKFIGIIIDDHFISNLQTQLFEYIWKDSIPE